jgi:hypothetical protein
MATVVQVQRFLDRPGGDCFWFYRGGAIAALNKALANAETHITDAMFCAVAMLAYIEVSFQVAYQLRLAQLKLQIRVESPHCEHNLLVCMLPHWSNF